MLRYETSFRGEVNEVFNEADPSELELRDALQAWEWRFEQSRGSMVTVVRVPLKPDETRNIPVIVDMLAVPADGPLFVLPKLDRSVGGYSSVYFRGARSSLVVNTEDPLKLNIGNLYSKPTVENHPVVIDRQNTSGSLVGRMPLMSPHPCFRTFVLDQTGLAESYGASEYEDVLKHVPLDDVCKFLAGQLISLPDTLPLSIKFGEVSVSQTSAWIQHLSNLLRNRQQQLNAIARVGVGVAEVRREEHLEDELAAADDIHRKQGTRGLVHHLVVAEAAFDPALTGEYRGRSSDDSLETTILKEIDDYSQKRQYLTYIKHGW